MKYLSLLFFTYLLALPIFAQQNSREGKDIAVFFTEEYKAPWDKLPLIKEEVAAIRAILEKKYHFITEEYKNEDAKGIEQRIEDLRSRKYAEDAQLFLFFSGHGYYRGTGRNVEGFFVPYNATKAITTFLSYRLLRPRINEIPCKHILVMIDACESGTFSDEVASREAPDWENENELQSEWVKEQLKDTTRYFASSVVKGRSPAKSDFAAKLINALNEPPKDGLLSISGLKSHLEKANPAPYFSGFGDHENGNFLFMTTPPLPPPPPAPLDTDKDGVPDKYDDCPTEIGVECASGCPDKDGDCITEKFGKDDCPDEKGERAFEGCPDTDKDGVPDYKDKCKNVYAATESGCPPKEPPKEVFPAPEMVYVASGTVKMDDTYSVKLSSYYIGKYEVTRGQFASFITDTKYETDAEKAGKSYVYENNDWHYKNDVTWRNDISGNGTQPNDHPVIHVSWNDAKAYCKWLSEKTGQNYNLPSEAQWQFAAIEGNSSRDYTYSGSNDLGSVGWYWDNANKNTHSVGSKGKNELGIYDMSGNVWEWCRDWYADYFSGSYTDAVGPETGSSQVLRGGSWNNNVNYCRVSNRNYYYPTLSNNGVGFRVVR